MEIRSSSLAWAMACALAAMAAAPAARAAPARQTGEIPVCSRSLGTLAVVESQGRNWWSGQRLASPTALIKVFVNRSRCFTLVDRGVGRSEEHTSELQSLMRISYAVFCLKK